MQITIPCEVYSRMSEIPLGGDFSDERRYMNCVYIERKENQLFVVVTNANVAAIECLGINTGPDEFTAIIADRALTNQCEQEIQFNGQLQIVANPALGFTNIKTSFGYNHNGNAMIALPDGNQFARWREWLPEEMATSTDCAMFLAAEYIRQLCIASKAAVLRFPKFISANQPVLVTSGPDWIGLFMPTEKDHKRTEPASIPDWAARS